MIAAVRPPVTSSSAWGAQGRTVRDGASGRNTFTGRLTEAMLDEIMMLACTFAP
jgi:hypothetical protein